MLASSAMYAFLIFGLPLGFALLYLRTYPREEAQDVRRALVRGMIAFVPTWLVARLLGSLVPVAYGSFLLSFHELADRVLPYACAPGALYLAFYRLRDDRGYGFQQRRLTAFYAGSLAPAGLCEMTRIWGAPDSYTLFALPPIMAAIALAAPRAVLSLRDAYGARLAGIVLASAAALLALSLGPWLFLAQLWPVSFALAALAVAAAWFLSSPELSRRAPRPAVG